MFNISAFHSTDLEAAAFLPLITLSFQDEITDEDLMESIAKVKTAVGDMKEEDLRLFDDISEKLKDTGLKLNLKYNPDKVE